MYCKKCGKEVDDDSLFCPFCGASLNDNDVEDEAEAVDVDNNSDRGPWKVFAIVGYVLGILSFVLAFFVGVGIEIAPAGIVFSALGKKSTDPEKKAKAEKGLKLSIAAIIISFVAIIAFAIILVATGAMDEFIEYLEDLDIEFSMGM